MIQYTLDEYYIPVMNTFCTPDDEYSMYKPMMIVQSIVFVCSNVHSCAAEFNDNFARGEKQH